MKKEFYQSENFWSDDSKYKRIDYPINDEIIKKTEIILDVKLPSSLVDLMKIKNGGD
ncbi:hypothetical protein AB3N02_31995 [Priestia aryabhattai]|uniref:hypothetical protein n=1 Tax=Priestia aryabhattai TaxID=412384 RepID=UPI0039A1443F